MVWAVISAFFWFCKYAVLVFGVCVCPFFTRVCVYIYMSEGISKCGAFKLIRRALGKAVSHISVLSIFKCLPISMDLSPKHRGPCECIGTCRKAWVVSVGPAQMQIILQVRTQYIPINGVRILKSKIHILYPVYSGLQTLETHQSVLIVFLKCISAAIHLSKVIIFSFLNLKQLYLLARRVKKLFHQPYLIPFLLLAGKCLVSYTFYSLSSLILVHVCFVHAVKTLHGAIWFAVLDKS